MRRHMPIGVLVAALLLSAAVPAWAFIPVEVEGGPGNQMAPSSNGTYLAWANQANASKGHSNVFVEALPAGDAERVNPPKSSAWMGGFLGTSTQLVYEQWRAGRASDVFFYDVTARTRTRAPEAVNTRRAWESDPVASDSYIAFKRSVWSGAGVLRSQRLLVYDRTSGVMTRLFSSLKRSIRFYPTFAGTTYVAWFVCGRTMCRSYYWSEDNGNQRVLVPAKKAAYVPTIDETAGQVYFVRAPANGKCGTKVTVGRQDLGSRSYTLLAALRRGIDAGTRLSLSPNSSTGFQDLYLDLWNCRTADADIYVLSSVDA
jgi:hypothetical protein